MLDGVASDVDTHGHGGLEKKKESWVSSTFTRVKKVVVTTFGMLSADSLPSHAEANRHRGSSSVRSGEHSTFVCCFASTMQQENPVVVSMVLLVGGLSQAGGSM